MKNARPKGLTIFMAVRTGLVPLTDQDETNETPELYNRYMTLIISTICPDGFVITSDSRAVDVRTNTVITDNAEKMFHLNNEIHGAFSGQGIPKNMHEILVDASNEYLNFEATYTMKDVCTFIKNVILSLPPKIVNDHRFKPVCVIAGHDRGLNNQKLRARHFTLSYENNYQADEGPGVLTIGAEVPETELDILEEASNKSVKASNRANKKLIELIAKSNVQVGGKIVSVTVRNGS